MFIVRNCFTAKAGQATKLAGMFKEMIAATNLPNARVLTDVTGEFNRVVMEFTTESIGEFETRMQEYGSNPVFREKMAGYTDLWLTGNREILKVH